MQAKTSFLLRNIGDIYFIVPDSRTDFLSAAQMLTTNETGAFLWNELSQPVTPDDLVHSLTTRYEVDKDTANTDVHQFLNGLKKIGALES